MSSELAPTTQPAGILARINENPFGALPPGWAGPVAFFAATKTHLFLSPTGLVANLLYWIKKGLTLDDATKIFQRLCDPEVTQGHTSDRVLMADMSALVARELRRRRKMSDMLRRREADTDAAAGAVVRLADSFSMPGGNRR